MESKAKVCLTRTRMTEEAKRVPLLMFSSNSAQEQPSNLSVNSAATNLNIRQETQASFSPWMLFSPAFSCHSHRSFLRELSPDLWSFITHALLSPSAHLSWLAIICYCRILSCICHVCQLYDYCHSSQLKGLKAPWEQKSWLFLVFTIFLACLAIEQVLFCYLFE